MAFDGIAPGQIPEQPFVGKRSEARAAGAKYYLNPRRLCQKHQDSARLVSSTACVACAHAYHDAHKDNINKRKRQHRIENPELYKARQAERYAKDPDYFKGYAKRWSDNNKERKSTNNKRWRDENRDYLNNVYLPDYCAKNPDYRTIKSENRRARKLAAPGNFTAKDVQEIFELQKGRCAYCGVKLKRQAKLTDRKAKRSDHIVPLHRGGSNHRKNIQILCMPCNSSKGAQDPIDWVRKKFGKLL